jgi:hypothetical protein
MTGSQPKPARRSNCSGHSRSTNSRSWRGSIQAPRGGIGLLSVERRYRRSRVRGVGDETVFGTGCHRHFLTSASIAVAQQWVSGYTKQNGTVVQPYWRSSPDNTTLNNYSTQGNINPYTGQAGTKSPYGSSGYGSGSGYGGYSSPGNDPTSLDGGGAACTGIFC